MQTYTPSEGTPEKRVNGSELKNGDGGITYNNTLKSRNSNSEMNRRNQFMVLLMQGFVWVTFIINLLVVCYYYPTISTIQVGNFITINGFTLLMWAAITLFSGIVYSFSTRYMQGFSRYKQFMQLILAITLSVMLFVSANHILLLAAGWIVMGISMAHMIGIVPGWVEAQKALTLSRRYFMSSSVLLTASLALLWVQTGHYTVSGILGNLEMLSTATSTAAAFGLILAGVIQASIFPFHRWLLSSMTAPTPSSALMHAGFVNAAGILLARFAPLLFGTQTLLYLFLIGAIGALLAQFWKLVQTTVKQRLACSTIAQMGFMLLQCGLGFFSAAVAHLILHGFYKAYLFLSSGSGVERKSPASIENDERVSLALYLPVIAGAGVLGGFLFAWLTGKGTSWNSGLFLTFVVVLTVLHAARQAVQQKHLTALHKLVIMPLVIMLSTTVYAAFFNSITLLMQDMPLSNIPVGLTVWHYLIAVLFLLTHIIIESGWYKKVPRAYAILLNMSQPDKETILAYKKSTL